MPLYVTRFLRLATRLQVLRDSRPPSEFERGFLRGFDRAAEVLVAMRDSPEHADQLAANVLAGLARPGKRARVAPKGPR